MTPQVKPGYDRLTAIVKGDLAVAIRIASKRASLPIGEFLEPILREIPEIKLELK